MQSYLQDLVNTQFYAFLVIFMRFGLAVMVMPGIGDSFVTPTVRLLFALAFCLVLTPAIGPLLPALPAQPVDLVGLLLREAFVGIFIGTVMRVLISALDTAGSIISMQIGFASALLFNPVTATQGSIVGSLYAMLGVTLIMVMNIHHYMLATVVDSYGIFPAGAILPDFGAFSEVIVRTVSISFMLGVQIAMPFLVVGLIMQAGFGVLGRLMPQIQIFFLALPVQIMVGMILLTMTMSAGILYWIDTFEVAVAQSLTP